MRRRNLLLGLGTAAGGAGAVGSGAFTSVSAQRDVAVSVADDTDAILRLEPGTGENADAFATVTDGTVGLDFSSTDAGGTGLGRDSTYQFDDLLRVQNQGTQRVYVFAQLSGGVSDDELYFYPGSDSTTRLRDGTDEVVPLDPGETVELGVVVDTEALDGDVTATATLTATADKPAESIQGGRGSVLVSNSGNGDFETIQAAVDAIEAGDADATTVEIDAGTFGGDGPIEVRDPNGLQFRGSGNGTDGTVVESQLRLSGGSPVDGVVVRNLRIAGVTGGPALGIGTGTQIVQNAIVDGVTVVDNGGDGVDVNPARNFELRNSVIENNGGGGVVVDGPGVGGTTLSVADSRIDGNGGEGVSAFSDSFESVSVLGTTVADNGGTGLFVGTPFGSDLGASADAGIGVAELIGVSATGNGGAGVLVSSETVSRVDLEDIAASDNTTDGIDLDGVDITGGTLSRVTVAGNGGTGVALGSFTPDAVVTGEIDRVLVDGNGDAAGASGIAVFDGVGVGTSVAVSNSNVVGNAGFGVSTDDADEIEVQLSNVFLDGNSDATSGGVSGESRGSPVSGVGADAD
jgi:hypothetical protein